MTDFCDIQKLAELFNPQRNRTHTDSEDDDDYTNVDPSKGIDTSTEAEGASKKPTPYAKIEPKEREPERGSECAEEDIEKFLEKEARESSDWRKSPKWDISYKQSVTASDVFLQIGGKNPSTASCEHMIITIHLPGEERHNIDLKVTKERLDMVSPNFRLGIPLPHPVDPQKGNAEWEKECEKLVITLTMNREFDYINF